MKVQLLDGISKHIEDRLFQLPYNKALVHQVVNSYLISSRAGSKSQKSRSEVRGGGKKPWRQKGTGRARSGTINSPIWRSGGVTFAAKPKSYKQKINKKMYGLAMRVILSELYRQNRILITDLLKVESCKTKDFMSYIAGLSLGLNALIIVERMYTNILLAARNLPGVKVIDVNAINPLDLVAYEKVLLEEKVLDLLSDRYFAKSLAENISEPTSEAA